MIRQFVKIDRFYPSSKTCSCCEHIYKDLTLALCESGSGSAKSVVLPTIGTLMPLTNILNQGMKIMSGCGMQSYNKKKQEEALLQLGESMKPEVQLSLG